MASRPRKVSPCAYQRVVCGTQPSLRGRSRSASIAVAMQGTDPVRLAGLDSLDPMGNGSLVHSGDNQTGRGDGDDETVTVEFSRIPPQITSIVFVAAAFKKGSSF